MKRLSIFLFILAGILSLNACKEDIDESNLYTFTGETIEDYLVNRSERFSSFNAILRRIDYDKILSAYGTYTCFAPTNEAVAEYIDSLYNDETKQDENPHNGMTQPGLDGLTDSLCRDIALFHLLSTKMRSIDMNGNVTLSTILGRDINTTLDSVSSCVVLNRDAQILSNAMDIDLENGILHEINHVITRSNKLIGGELASQDNMQIFKEALEWTGLLDSLTAQSHTNFVMLDAKQSKGFYVPQECKLGFTIFVETDDVLKANNIKSCEDLARYANEAYKNCANSKDTEKKEGWYDYFRNNGIKVSTSNDYKEPNNALNMFVRYHIIKSKVARNKLVYRTTAKGGTDNTSNKVTRVEYYETMLPYTLLKVTLNAGKYNINFYQENTSLTNRRNELGTLDMRPVKFQGVEILSDFISSWNGYIHPINSMLVYNWDVPNGALKERMRFDYGALFGEMQSNNLRHMDDNELNAMNGGKTGSDGAMGGNLIRIPEGFLENMVIYNGESTRMLYGPFQTSSWYNYQKDEFNCLGAYDFAVRMPPVPDGVYELRMGYTAETKRGMVQIYLGNSSKLASMKAVDIPLDMRIMPGSYPVSQTLTEDNPCIYTGQVDPRKTSDDGVQSDANMRNLGYMRGPLAYSGEGGTLARYAAKDLRRIIVRDQFRQGEYWLRFKNVLKNDEAEFHMDYIEFCPASVYNNSEYAEDMY
jgi:uncharacterized surface protein with fasciclin (FAS1) repeats